MHLFHLLAFQPWNIKSYMCIFKRSLSLLIWNYGHIDKHERFLMGGNFGMLSTIEQTQTKSWTRGIKPPPRISVSRVWFPHIKTKLKKQVYKPKLLCLLLLIPYFKSFWTASCLQNIMKSLALEGSHGR